MTIRENIAVCALVLGLSCVGVSDANAYGIDAYSIYRQAQKQNHRYFQILKRYDGVIDLKTKTGDTAYCLALKGNNETAIDILEKYGANKKHECVKRFGKKQKEKIVKKEKKVESRKTAKTKKFIGDDSSNTYLWAGLGVLAVGGGIAALSGGGGGSGSSNSNDNSNNGGGNYEGDKVDEENTIWDVADK